jgi:hypothetical protein
VSQQLNQLTKNRLPSQEISQTFTKDQEPKFLNIIDRGEKARFTYLKIWTRKTHPDSMKFDNSRNEARNAN